MKIIKYLQELSVLREGISETIKNEAKAHKDGFLPNLLGTLVAILISCQSHELLGVITTDEESIRASQNFNSTSSFDQF